MTTPDARISANSRPAANEKETGRLEAFSDGIFGVAITLLALEIGIPADAGATNASLWHAIVERWPEYFAYFNSFAVVLLIWMGHHRILKPVRTANTPALLLNGLVLLLVALFPFPTRTVGRFIDTEAASTAVAFYAGFTGAITLSLTLLAKYLQQHRWLLVEDDRGVRSLAHMLRWQWAGIVAYAMMAAGAFVAPRLALAGTFLMWAFWAGVVAASDERPNGRHGSS